MPEETSGTTVTLRKEWLTILVICVVIVIAEGLSILAEPRDFAAGRNNVYSVAAGLIWWLGHAVWLSMDRSRRGLDSGGPWRYLVIFLGPVAIWLYLIVEYRLRALYLIPLSLAIYAAMAGTFLVFVAVGAGS